MKKLLLWTSVLYALTWIGGVVVYRRDMAARAKVEYAKALEVQAELHSESGAARSIVHPNGPSTSLNWSVPILPTLLLVSSDYYIGPRWAHGGIRLVWFYGVGTLESRAYWEWVS